MIKKYIVSKIYKLPIEGIQFSNKQIGLTIEYEPVGAEEFDINEANDEVNQMLTIVKEQDPSWLHQLAMDSQKTLKEKVKEAKIERRG